MKRFIAFVFWTAAWWWMITIIINMGAPPMPEEPKFPTPKTWDERHPDGWSEWGNEKREAVPVIKWPEENSVNVKPNL